MEETEYTHKLLRLKIQRKSLVKLPKFVRIENYWFYMIYFSTKGSKNQICWLSSLAPKCWNPPCVIFVEIKVLIFFSIPNDETGLLTIFKNIFYKIYGDDFSKLNQIIKYQCTKFWLKNKYKVLEWFIFVYLVVCEHPKRIMSSKLYFCNYCSILFCKLFLFKRMSFH